MCREQLFEKHNELAAIVSMLGSSDSGWDDFDIPWRDLDVEPPHIEPVNGQDLPLILTLEEDVTVRIDSRVAACTLVLAGNVVIAMERVQGHPLSEVELAEFRHIAKAMYTFLEDKHGDKLLVR